MNEHLKQAGRVYEAIEELSETEGKRVEEAARRIVYTNIIPGLLVTILLQDVDRPNGSNLIDDYLASLSVSIVSSFMSLKYPNNISKQVNRVLRLLCHGQCSFIRRLARGMPSEREFQSWVSSFLQQVQRCHSIGSICRTIRSTREIQKKTPSNVYKGFDSATGDVCVGGVEILKIVWSRSIPTTLDKLDTHIRSLFFTESHHHISQLFDVANPFVWLGEDSKFTVDGQSFFLRDIHPLFPRSVCQDFMVSTFLCAHTLSQT